MTLYRLEIPLRATASALLVAVAATAWAGTTPEPTRTDGPVTILKIGPYDLRTVVLGGADCLAGAGVDAACDVKVELVRIQGTGRPFCLATAPTVKPTFGPGETRKRVVWTLRPQSPGNGTFDFHELNGILIVTPKVAGHITDLRRVNSPLVRQFSGQINKVSNGPQKGDSSYVPVVIWKYTDSNGAVLEELCAAVDPRIVNN